MLQDEFPFCQRTGGFIRGAADDIELLPRVDEAEAAADCSSSGSSSVLPPYSSSSWPAVRSDFTRSSFFCPLELLQLRPERVHMKETSNKNNTEFFIDHLQRCFVEDLAEVEARNVLEVSV